MKKGYPSFEYRESQLSFMDVVWERIIHKLKLLQKSLQGLGRQSGILLPAAIHSFQTGKPVVISTFTNHLVDQILEDEVEASSEDAWHRL